jgi:hypothetical protein
MRDPIGILRRIYAHVGLVFTGEVEDRMRRFLAANPQNKEGEHRYRLDDFGLDPMDIAERFRGYCECFAVQREAPDRDPAVWQDLGLQGVTDAAS